MLKLLVGLGNPGPEYEQTRHNAGFWWIDAVAAQLKTRLVPERSYHGLLARVNRPSDGPLWLLEPQTYMNRSGQSVAALARFFKIAPQEILVVHDELDLPPGQMRLKQGGGSAGHNGLKDITAQLGSADYWRLRLGVGHPGERSEVVNYVLCKPSPSDRQAITECMSKSIEQLDLLLSDDMGKASSRLNTKPPKPPKAPPSPQRLESENSKTLPASAPSGGSAAISAELATQDSPTGTKPA